MIQNKQRIEWIDTIKGIGIILVLIGHCNIPNINQYIYLFHMPLFYIISGYCWNVDKNRNLPFKDFFNKKFNSYIIPYLKIAGICFLIFGLGTNIIRLGLGSDYCRQLGKYLFGIVLYSRGTTEWLPNCSPIWFLTALFFAELFFYWIMKRKKSVIWVVLSGLMGYICYLIGKVFPWNIDNAFTAIPFIYVGVLLRKNWTKISRGIYVLPLFLCSIIIFYMGICGGDYDSNYLKYIYITGIEAILISISIFVLGHRFGGGNPALSFLGRNTLFLFGYNYAINTCLLFVIPSISQTWVMAVVVVFVSSFLAYVTNKFKIRKYLI